VKVLLDGLQIGNRSGTGAYAHALAREIPDLADQIDMTVVVTEDGKNALEPSRNRHLEITKNVGRGRQFNKHAATYLKTIKRDEPQIVHFPATFAMLRKPISRPETIVILTIHDLAFLRNPKWFRLERARYYRSKIRQSIRVAHQLIADSEATAADMIELLGIERNKIHVVPLGVPADLARTEENAHRSAQKKYSLPEKYFLYLGTIEPRKNIESIINAYSHIADKTDWDLVIAGRDGWKTKSIYRAAKKSPVRDRIHFPGFVDSNDMPAILSGAEVFVWPSLMEGFGLPPLEAMACGTPVLTSNLSSLPEVVGDAAVKVDPYSISDISKYMLMLYEDESLRKRLIASGLNRARLFHWQQCAQKTYSVYQQILRDA